MRRSWFYRQLEAQPGFSEYIATTYPGVDMWAMQDQPPSAVLRHTGPALALGRRLNTQTYAAYTAGAGWSNSSAQLALHTAGSVATLAHAGLLAVSKTYQIVTIISGRTAGSVILTGTGAVSMTADATYTDNITALGTALTYTPTTDFDGTINCATVTVKQTGILASSQYPGANVIINGDFAADTNWTKGDAAITIGSSKATWSGAQAGNADLTATVAPLTAGLRYKITYTVSGYSAGTITPLIGTTAGTAQSANGTFTEERVAATTAFVLRGNADFAGSVEIVTVQPADPMNGVNTGITMGQVAAGNLGYAGLFDGANDYGNNYSAEINSKFNPSAGTLIAFAKVPAAAWTDGVNRYILELEADINNKILIYKQSSPNNQLVAWYKAGGANDLITPTMSPTGYFMVAFTWDTGTANKVELFIDGVSVGTSATLGAWVGNLAATTTVIGASATTPTNVWSGNIAYVILGNYAMTATEIADIWKKSGI